VTVNGNDNRNDHRCDEVREGAAAVKKKVTIREVATAAGVSHQTVSRVINNRPDVAEETRRRVWQVIEELNYQPSAIARSLIRQRSFALGVVTAGLKYVGPSRTLNGITKQAEEMGYTLLLKELPGFYTNEIQPLLNSLLARQVDGIIWAVPEIGRNRDWLQSWPPGLDVPMIFLTMQSRPDLFVVSVDNYAGGRMATEHLLEQGCKHIGHLSGPLDWWEARQRKAGWLDALYEAGREVGDHQWAPGTWSAASGEQAMRRLLDSYPEMDGLFVANDQMALGVLQVACRDGLEVAQELAVVGFDGIPEAAYYWPPLTTVYQDLRELGSTAVRELSQIVEAGHRGEAGVLPKAISLDPELIVRESSTLSKL
jgi:LacI family transcriptional regulator